MNEEKVIWAKSPIELKYKLPTGEEKTENIIVSLKEHTDNVGTAFGDLEFKINDKPHLKELIKIAIKYHDLGKVCPYFQIRTLGNEKYLPFDVSTNIYHSLFSVLWIDKNKLREEIKTIEGIKEEDVDDYQRFVLSAVAYHHWKESFEDLMRFGGNDFERMKELLERKTNGKTNEKILIDNLRKEGFEGIEEVDIKMLEGLSNGAAFANYVIPPYQLYWLPKRIDITKEKEKEWILLAGFLMRCDHFASYKETEKEECKIENKGIKPEEIKRNIIKGIVSKVAFFNANDSKQFWQSKTISEYGTENTILIAPTGSGKTEFSFMWSNGEKFFYTLPLRSAVNQIFERAKKIFGEDKAGLLHSDADVYVYSEEDEANSYKLYEQSKQLSYPAMISTGDQFFPYALRPPGYEKIFATFYKSRLIIDEVQAYDPKSAAIIVKFIEAVVRLEGKFLLMTATLPDYIKEAIEERVEQFGIKLPGEIDLYEDEKYKKLKKHRIAIHLIENEEKDFSFDESIFSKIINIANDGKRVLVILNTVKQAQYVYKGLTETYASEMKDRIWLFHSRFTLADRKSKELELVNKEFKNPKDEFSEKMGKILIATQVVEASLDIDADVLFTEIAPMDSLVQRMGRVLRRKKDDYSYDKMEPNVKVIVFRNGYQSGGDYVYKNELIEKTYILLNSFDQVFDLDKQQLDQIIAKYYVASKFLWEEESEIKVGNKKKAKGKKNVVPAEEPILELPNKVYSILLSEYEKYLLVSKLYSILNKEGMYLKKFYETLSILDSGYMSDRKSEAQKMFREINTFSVIPADKKECLIEKIKEFCDNTKYKQIGTYTKFKKEILSEFVVSVPAYSQPTTKDYYNSFEYWLKDIDLSAQWKSKIKHWCRDIYFGAYNYDKDKGTIITDKTNSNDNLIW